MRDRGKNGEAHPARERGISYEVEAEYARGIAGRPVIRLCAVGIALLAAAWAGSACTAGDAATTERDDSTSTAASSGSTHRRTASPSSALQETAAPSSTLAADSALTALLAEIQPGVERSSGIEASAPVHVARADSARLRAYIEEQLRSELPPAKVAALTAAYARLGLLPDTLDLTALLRSLLEEQVVGYYDPERDTLYVMEDVPTAQLEVILAHELVHALQDQRIDLDSLRMALRDRNDAMLGAQAAIEGHATFAMTEWQMGRVTGGAADLTLLPDLGEQLAGLDLTAMADGGSVQVLRAAPAVIREGLVFPYLHGLAFLQRMWKSRDGRPIPFDADLPRSTEQVLHFDRYMDRDFPTPLRFSETPPPGWETVYESDLGELETRIFLSEHLGDRERAEGAASGWDGDAYRLVRGPAGDALAWLSAWDSSEDADEFAAAVEAAYEARYAAEEAGDRRVTVGRETIGGAPAVVVLDVPAGVRAELAARLGRVTPDGDE